MGHRPCGVARAAVVLALLSVGCSDSRQAGPALAGPRGLSVCPTLVPLRPRTVGEEGYACQRAIVASGSTYLAEVLAAQRACLDPGHPGPVVPGDPVHPCLGLRELSTGVYRDPSDSATGARTAAARARARAEISAACQGRAPDLGHCASGSSTADCVIAEYHDAAQLLLDQAYGDLGAAPADAAACGATIGRAAGDLVVEQVRAIGECLLEVGSGRGSGAEDLHLARACIGEVGGGRFVAPAHPETADRLAAAESAFRGELRAACGDEDVAALDACGGDLASVQECLRCTHRREAMSLVQATFEGDPDRVTRHFIDWAALRNPLVQWPDRRIKDQVMALRDGWFYVFGSIDFADDDPERETRVRTHVRTRDWQTFEEIPTEIFPGGTGVASPDLTFIDGEWITVYQRADDLIPENRRLFLSRSSDLMVWSDPIEVVAGVLPDQSIIDGALARRNGRYYLLMKWRQEDIPWLAATPGGELGTEWIDGGRLVAGNDHPFYGFAENGQFLDIDGRIRMLATVRDPEGFRCGSIFTCSHEPALFELASGDGSTFEDWKVWRHKTHLRVPYEGWNTVMHANTGYIADWREQDGFFYMSYSGANDFESFQGRGHGKIGLVRSRDLLHWRVPGDLRD